jgi:hypothetical protein
MNHDCMKRKWSTGGQENGDSARQILKYSYISASFTLSYFFLILVSLFQLSKFITSALLQFDIKQATRLENESFKQSHRNFSF